MSATAPSLARLAALAGLGVAYRDTWGNERRVAPDTLAAALAAMGIAADTPEAIADSIAALEAEAWRPMLPPSVVARGGDGVSSVAIALPERLDAGRILWTVDCEDGSACQGEADAQALGLLAANDAGHERHVRRALPLARLPLGYHRLTVSAGHEAAEAVLIVVPETAYLPDALAGAARSWGITTQLYALRSARNWGIGDYGDLAAFAALAAARGAQTVGINPLHALFPAEPRHVSPYSPSSRRFRNPLYLDVTAVPEFADCAAAQALAGSEVLARARGAALVDHGAVAAVKWPAFTALYRAFESRHLAAGETERGVAFRRFQHAGGAALAEYATFNALQADRLARGESLSWHDWPAALRDPRSATVRRFAAEHRAAIELHQYLEWEGERQLEAAARQGRAAGLALGFYADLAVGVDPGGADAWSDPSLNIAGATVGAPPDMLNLKGQDWGLAATNPAVLRRQAYAPVIAALRAAMRHAGVLRIDHAMALEQLYWIPRGAAPTEGVYVRYPREDLIGVVALESRRHRCAVVGEDLGTVPAGFSARLNAAAILSCRVLMFERAADGAFTPPQTYPRCAAATCATHDVATLRGFWLGRDLEWRRALGLYPDEAAAAADRAGRRADRRRLIAALRAAGVLGKDAAERLLPSDDAPVYALELAEAVHRFLGLVPSALALMQIEDALGEIEQANVPGTVDAHPNWCRRLSRAIEDIAGDAGFRRVTAALAAGRAA
ncbi:MAG TPA: 4-alpha-glucanotransferase [Stellaceae bacterium]|nr:4-alpha-glucanotransferase [Stellaceae bacterium]